ncbi:MAG: GyrI-like domain-containing protein [Salibacteraceae bacterium]
MKALKIIGGIVALLVLTILIIALFVPNENHLERSIVIEAPIEQVRGKVSSFEQMLKWSPWAERDPNQKVTIQNDGAVGALYEWNGVDTLVGAGSQTITEMTDNKVVTRLKFIRPWEIEADAITELEQLDEGVEVTWIYEDYTTYPLNVFNLLFDIEKTLGPDFSAGMNKLKVLVEEEVANRTEFKGYEVAVKELEPRTYVGFKQKVSWDAMETFFNENLGSVFQKVSEEGLRVIGQPCAVYYDWDEADRSAVILACAPVMEENIEGMDEFEHDRIAGRAMVVDHYGDYSSTMNAHLAIEEYIEWHGIKTSTIAIEEYITGPAEEPDTNKWHTRIYYPF